MSCDSAASNARETISTIGVVAPKPNELAVLTAAELRLFSEFGRSRTVRAGDVLFRRGDGGSAMFVIGSGVIDLDFGEDLVVKHLGHGEFFGELGLLIGSHMRSADAIAASDGVLVELDHDDFQRLVERDPGLVAYFLRRTIMRVVMNEQTLIRQLRRRNHDLEAALDNLYTTTHQLTQTEELVRTDELTGLHNRRGLILRLQECRRDGRSPGPGLLLIDCDRFKHINDAHGHLVGDRVLQNVANILRSVVGQDDIACRLGGDEFCLLVATGNVEDLRRIGEFVIATVQNLLGVPHPSPHICPVSIGISRVDPQSDWNDWYANADAALYEAKRLGGNRLYWHDRTSAPC
ncbi:signal transduction protein [Xanthomonas translucens pv. poae]|uniref:diguanylate cyclase n=1 Tax=Xanthomonas graminis pv. poae TaxID=227946 RepID=A0A0K2ZNF5_9XANT|nr:GGDEF domain-containing protein [Xanthomonas translucens]UKE62237.1 GGDEF domain-containing protein [Xanthomonas translucens pv. poae]CTP84940.1 signal transduction protein [Xanthomonas translucens pv. poae]